MATATGPEAGPGAGLAAGKRLAYRLFSIRARLTGPPVSPTAPHRLPIRSITGDTEGRHVLPAVPSPAMPFRSRSPRCARRCPSRRRALRSSTRQRSRRHPDCWQRSAPSAGDPDPSLGCVVGRDDSAGRALVWTGRGPARLAAVTQTPGGSRAGGLTRREPRRGGAEPGQRLGDDVGPHAHPVARVDLHAGLDRQGGWAALSRAALPV